MSETAETITDPRMGFFVALSEFQAECPPIRKSKEVMNKDGKTVRYRYAPLDEIVKTVRPLLHERGLLFMWDTEPTENGLHVTCHLQHVGGHRESSSFTVPKYSGYGTNVAQDEGSASTFGRRYTLANVLGLTIDEDDDGASAATPNHDVLVSHNKVAREWLPSILAAKECLASNDKEGAAEVIAEMSRPVFNTLWRAPSNGGLWTVEERKIMKDDTEFKDYVHARRKDAGWYDKPENQL